jgi:hypothetical protein
MQETRYAVWVKGVEWDRAIKFLRNGCGRRIVTWDDRTWRFWRELGWDGRPDSELNIQPPEVHAYTINPSDMCLLGIWSNEPAYGVLFVYPDVQWAAVASYTRIEAEDADDADDA